MPRPQQNKTKHNDNKTGNESLTEIEWLSIFILWRNRTLKKKKKGGGRCFWKVKSRASRLKRHA